MLKFVVGVVLLAVLIHLDPGGGFAGIGAITTLIKDCVQSKHEWCDDKFPYIPPKLAVAMAFDRLEPTTEDVADKYLGKDNKDGLKNKVFIITGASSGLGYQAASTFLNRGATVIFGVRSVSRGEKALKEIMDNGATGKGHVIELELSDLDSVELFVKSFETLELPLHTLINNAAIMMPGYGEQQYSKQGYEKQFGVNQLSHFYLTSLLEDKILASGTKEDPSRVVYITTSGIEFWRGPDDDGSMKRQIPAMVDNNYHSFFGYVNSKALNVITGKEQQRRWNEQGVNNAISFSVNPGLVGGYFSGYSDTTPTMLDQAGAMKGAFYSWPFAHAAKTAQQGGSTLVYAAIASDVINEVIERGAFYYNNNKITTAGGLSGHPEWFTNDNVNKEVWNKCEALLVDRK